MTYTSHGHHILGTKIPAAPPVRINRCGGLTICPTCKQESAAELLAEKLEQDYASMAQMPEDFIAKARNLLKVHVDYRLRNLMVKGDDLPAYEIYVTTFAKTLDTWRAWMGTTLGDKLHYELIYKGSARKTIIKTYRQLESLTIPD